MSTEPNILLLGGDGYLGWPLAVKLATRYPKARLTLVDTGLRRRLVAEAGGNSVVPILPLQERVQALQRILGPREFKAVELDVADPALDSLVAELQPTHVYHLAQQASAPYSMRSPEAAMFTVRNNEQGNLRLLWALKRHAPTAQLIKLGSFGEYARSDIPVAEGYFKPSYGGVTASTPMPYPRGSSDIYHITKINDSNFIAMACEKWGLRVTELMQATVVGTNTAETAAHPELSTRFDYDEMFGTVLNRFLSMVLIGHPMVIYGTGCQRTGLMALDDSLSSMAAMLERPADAGEHRVINHVTERRYSINELADKVTRVTAEHGYKAKTQRGVHDPRCEQDAAKLNYAIETAYIDKHVTITPLEQIIRQTLDQLLPHASRIDPGRFPPVTRW